MRYYPVFLDITGRSCVVAGGGVVAERKVQGLLKARASVTVISPRVTKVLEKLAQNGTIRLIRRKYKKGDLLEAAVVISATASKAVNKEIFEEAARLKTLVNVVDDRANCNFIVPSVIDRGGLIIAISTSGKAPGLARKIREDLERYIGSEYEDFTSIAGAVRKKLLKNEANHDKKKRVIEALADSPILDWLRRGDREVREINSFLKGLLGAGFTLSRLGVKLKTGPKVSKTTKPKKGTGV